MLNLAGISTAANAHALDCPGGLAAFRCFYAAFSQTLGSHSAAPASFPARSALAPRADYCPALSSRRSRPSVFWGSD